MNRAIIMMNDQQRELAAKNISLVAFTIDRMGIKYNPFFVYADTVMAGYEGLCNAAMKYDPSRGYSFSTFAMACIKTEINHMYSRYQHCGRDKHHFYIALDYKPDGDKPLYELIGEEDESLVVVESKIVLQEAIEKLKPIEKTVLKMKRDGMLQTDMAQRLGVTQSYISRIIITVRKKLK